MVFIQATDGMLFVMLSEADVTSIRQGRTVFVKKQQLQGHKFDNVVISLSKSDTDSLELIRKAGHRVDKLVNPEPGPKDSTCKGCQGIIATASMFEDKCIVCWATEAKQKKIESN